MLLIILVALCSSLSFCYEVAISQTVDSYHPDTYALTSATRYVSGSLGDLQADDGTYMTFQSYASQASPRSLYAHQEKTSIAGTDYYISSLDVADMTGTNLSTSLSSAGRRMLGSFIYPLTGVTSIPSSIWTVYYRTWFSNLTADISEASPSWVPHDWWENAEYAYSSDDTYANSSTPVKQEYGGYGFDLPPTANITKVEVGYEAYTLGDEKIGITLSVDGGIGWTAEYASPSLGTTDQDIVNWIDLTTAANWTASMFSDSNFRSGVSIIKVGPHADSVFLDWLPVRVAFIESLPSAHEDVNVCIRRSDGAIRQTLAINVANSESLSATAQTLSATYDWPGYTVVNETDYLEIDYFADISSPNPVAIAYFRIDDVTSATANQTRVVNIMLPSEYTVEVELSGYSGTHNWAKIVWTIDMSWTTDNVSVTLQLYDYLQETYPTAGNGYIVFQSSSFPNTDETKTQSITTNTTNFRDYSGSWRMRIKGVKLAGSQFSLKLDLGTYQVTPVVYSSPWNWTWAVVSVPFIILLFAGIGWKKRKPKSKSIGIEFLNEITDGGIPDSFSVMLVGSADSGKSILFQELAYVFLKMEKPCVYVTYECFPDEIRENMKKFQWNTSTFESQGKLLYIDCFSSTAKVQSKEKYFLSQPFSLVDLGIIITKATNEAGNGVRVFLDTIVSLLTQLDPGRVVDFLQDRIARVKGVKGNLILTLNKESIDPALVSRLEEIVDCIIELDVNEVKGEIVRRLRVKKMRGRNFSDRWVRFEISREKGILFPI
jgi:KaiC/GvpD/RAD55 family RecA-like ATPase